ncbi:MAG: hypothetical protein OEZ25_01855 [Candidatus Bathyarchaeota archaeon]|nr:hypothetical protein [Candidatus Bathyarchaeota archaeon]
MDPEEWCWRAAKLTSEAKGKPLGDCLISAILQVSLDVTIPPGKVIKVARSLYHRAVKEVGKTPDIIRYYKWHLHYFGLPNDVID